MNTSSTTSIPGNGTTTSGGNPLPKKGKKSVPKGAIILGILSRSPPFSYSCYPSPSLCEFSFARFITTLTFIPFLPINILSSLFLSAYYCSSLSLSLITKYKHDKLQGVIGFLLAFGAWLIYAKMIPGLRFDRIFSCFRMSSPLPFSSLLFSLPLLLLLFYLFSIPFFFPF